MSTEPDLDIHLLGILARDTNAFAAWMASAEGPLRESLRSFARVVDVEAVLQEALLRVWNVAPRFIKDDKPNGLLRLGVRIARNLAISEVRRLRSMLPEDAAEEPSVAPEEPDPLLRRVLTKCVELLPDQPRKVLESRFQGGDDLDLAEALGMRLNTFLQNFGRARKMLSECLRKNGVEGYVA